MTDWHDEFTEPMHDTPADRNQLILAMEAASYTYDAMESTDDNLRFFGTYGQTMTMSGWQECEEWLNGVVFDDPQVSDHVEMILHPERFPEKNPARAALHSVEDLVEQNDNSFDGVINNLPEHSTGNGPSAPDAASQTCRCADEEERKSVLTRLKKQQETETIRHSGRCFISGEVNERSRE